LIKRCLFNSLIILIKLHRQCPEGQKLFGNSRLLVVFIFQKKEKNSQINVTFQ
jgi:hypothetical protein